LSQRTLECHVSPSVTLPAELLSQRTLECHVTLPAELLSQRTVEVCERCGEPCVNTSRDRTLRVTANSSSVDVSQEEQLVSSVGGCVMLSDADHSHPSWWSASLTSLSL